MFYVEDIFGNHHAIDENIVIGKGSVNGGTTDPGVGGLADWVTTDAVGNLAAGTNVNGKSAVEILKLMTVSYQLPSATVSYSHNKDINIKTEPFNVTVTVTNVKGGTNIPTKIDLYVKGKLKESKPYSIGASSYIFSTITGITETTKFEVRVYDTENKYKAYTKQYTCIGGYTYVGVLDDIPSDAATITSLEKVLRNKGDYTKAFNANGQYIVLAYPASFGNLTSIKDGMNFENFGNFTKLSLSISGEAYFVYYTTTKTTASNFNLTFKY